jgi:hypothetical protein
VHGGLELSLLLLVIKPQLTWCSYMTQSPAAKVSCLPELFLLANLLRSNSCSSLSSFSAAMLLFSFTSSRMMGAAVVIAWRCRSDLRTSKLTLMQLLDSKVHQLASCSLATHVMMVYSSMEDHRTQPAIHKQHFASGVLHPIEYLISHPHSVFIR